MHGLVCGESEIWAKQGLCSIPQAEHTMSGCTGCIICHAQPWDCRTHISGS